MMTRLPNPSWRAELEQMMYSSGANALAAVGPPLEESGWTAPTLHARIETLINEGNAPPFSNQLQIWQAIAMALWVQEGMPKVVLGHKVAAALMASTAEGAALRYAEAPFRAFYIELPDNLLRTDSDEIGGVLVVRYDAGSNPHGTTDKDYGWAWIGFARTEEVVGGWGMTLREMQVYDLERERQMMTQRGFEFGEFGETISEREKRLWGVIGRLIVGTMIYMHMGHGARRLQKTTWKPKYGRSQRPPERPIYEVRPNIQIDLRDDVLDYLEGRTKEEDEESTPRGSYEVKVRVKVRGHFKLQPYGPGASLRKLIFREPYWRGPEEGAVVIRSHMLGDVG
jgi:hypothetical protein